MAEEERDPVMTDKVEGFLEVGMNERKEVVVNHPDLKPDEDGVGHVVFSPSQARHLAHSLLRFADAAEVPDDVKRVRKGWESSPLHIESFTLEPDDSDGLPGEKCFLVRLTVLMTSWPVGADPLSIVLPQRWKQEVVFKVGLLSGMWSVAENGAAPVTTVLLPR
jgi:hypothetical protein